MGTISIHARQKKILEYLINQRTWVKGRQLAAELGVTDRTVRNDVSYINSLEQDVPELIISHSQKGYYIQDCTRAVALLKAVRDDLPKSPEERANYILKRLIFEKKQLDFYELAGEMLVSESTLENDLKRVREIIGRNENNLKLVKKSGYINVEGSEKEKRRLLSQLLYQEANCNFFKLEEYTKYFHDLDLHAIQQHLIELTKKYDIKLNDLAVINLIVHIAITIDRIKRQNVLDSSFGGDDLENSQEYKISQELCSRLKEKFDVEFPKTEVAYISYLILGKKIIKNIYNNRDELKSWMEPYFLQLTESLLQSINSEFGIELLNDEVLFIGLCLHFRTMLDRIKYGMTLRNPLLGELKRKYFFVFQVTVYLANEFYKLTGFRIDEDEMGYIALHLGAALERIREKKRTVKRIVLVCPTGHTTSGILLSKLNSLYKDKLEVIGNFSIWEVEAINKRKPDLVISTVPLDNGLTAKTITVSPFLSENDIRTLNTYFDLESPINGKSRLHSDIDRFFRENIFYKDVQFADEFTAINFMANQLLKKGYVPADYPDLVIKREELSSTAFGNMVAIPHPLVMNAFQTVISVVLLEKPMVWKTHKVQLILMFAIRAQDRKELDGLYNYLVNIMDKSNGVSYLLESRDFQDFKNRLLNYHVDETN